MRIHGEVFSYPCIHIGEIAGNGTGGLYYGVVKRIGRYCNNSSQEALFLTTLTQVQTEISRLNNTFVIQGVVGIELSIKYPFTLL